MHDRAALQCIKRALSASNCITQHGQHPGQSPRQSRFRPIGSGASKGGTQGEHRRREGPPKAEVQPPGAAAEGAGQARATQAARTGRGGSREAARRVRVMAGLLMRSERVLRPARGGRTGDQVQGDPGSCRSTRCAAAIARGLSCRTNTQTGHKHKQVDAQAGAGGDGLQLQQLVNQVQAWRSFTASSRTSTRCSAARPACCWPASPIARCCSWPIRCRQLPARGLAPRCRPAGFPGLKVTSTRRAAPAHCSSWAGQAAPIARCSSSWILATPGRRGAPAPVCQLPQQRDIENTLG